MTITTMSRRSEGREEHSGSLSRPRVFPGRIQGEVDDTRVSKVTIYIIILFKDPPEAGVKDPATSGLAGCEATGLCEDPAKTGL